MANAEASLEGADAASKKKGALGLILGVVLALVLGGGGFYAVWSGLILAPMGAEKAEAPAPKLEPLADIAFVPVGPIVISLGPGSEAKHLRFQAQLEVQGQYQADVERLLPRVVDVLNSYLRAVEPSTLEERGALTRLRSQMLRRAQIVIGEGRVRDLLIMEFVLT